MAQFIRQKSRLTRSHYVYVVELDKTVWTDSWKFRKANPQYKGMLECLYVGMSSLPPQVRFGKHKSGAKSKKGVKISSWYVEKYGRFLRPSLYHHLNPLTKENAKSLEGRLSERLRRQGYAVWWN